jgi:hypothetical protein
MYRFKKVLAASITLTAALLIRPATASACTASPAVKAQIASPLSIGLGATAIQDELAAPGVKGKASGFVGLWDSKVISDGQVIDEGFDAFHSDGTEVLVDESAPATDNVCLGIWEQTGPSTIKLKHPSWYFDLNGNLLGVVIIRETLTLDPDCDSYHGASTEDIYDTHGNKIGHYTAEIRATRITVD